MPKNIDDILRNALQANELEIDNLVDAMEQAQDIAYDVNNDLDSVVGLLQVNITRASRAVGMLGELKHELGSGKLQAILELFGDKEISKLQDAIDEIKSAQERIY